MVYVAWVGRVSAAMFVFLYLCLPSSLISHYTNALDLVRLDKSDDNSKSSPVSKKNIEAGIASLTNLVVHLRKVFTYKDCFHVRGTTSYYVTHN